MNKQQDQLEKLFRDFAGAAPEISKSVKALDLKPIAMPIEFAIFNENNQVENAFQPAIVTGISSMGFCFMSSWRLFPKAKLSFFGRAGKRFSGAAEVVSCKKEKNDYLVHATFLYIDIGKGTPIRRFPRQPIKRAFNFQVQQGGLSYQAQLLDISKIGLRFFCRYHLKAGDLIYTGSFSKDDSSAHTLRVVWTRPAKNGMDVGAEFL